MLCRLLNRNYINECDNERSNRLTGVPPTPHRATGRGRSSVQGNQRPHVAHAVNAGSEGAPES